MSSCYMMCPFQYLLDTYLLVRVNSYDILTVGLYYGCGADKLEDALFYVRKARKGALPS